jgi:hypothetical protein
MGTITTRFSHGYRQGDRIAFPTDTNRMRRAVSEIVSDTVFYTVVYVRPSRGFAKYNRRHKVGAKDTATGRHTFTMPER